MTAKGYAHCFLLSKNGGNNAMRDEAVVKTTLRVPQSLWQKAKIRSVKDRVSFQSLMLEALRAYLKGERQ